MVSYIIRMASLSMFTGMVGINGQKLQPSPYFKRKIFIINLINRKAV